jgi:hypothetical protein
VAQTANTSRRSRSSHRHIQHYRMRDRERQRENPRNTGVRDTPSDASATPSYPVQAARAP